MNQGEDFCELLRTLAGVSHFGCLQWGHRAGLVSIRFSQEWLQRRHLHLYGLVVMIHDTIMRARSQGASSRTKPYTISQKQNMLDIYKPFGVW